MTEPNDPSATGYMPISCDLHSEYELAILRRQWLRLVWSDENSARNTIHDQIVLPLDLKTVSGDDSRDGGRSGPSRPSRGITPSLEGRGRAASGTAAEEFLMCRTKDSVTRNIRRDRVQRMYPA